MKNIFFMVISFFSLGVVIALQADDWPTWRGPNGTGASSEKNVPLEWSVNENVVWKATLDEPGNSSPVVARGKVFITQALDNGKKRCLICFDRHSGEKLWQRETSYAELEPTHKTNPYCSASPATDGKVIVATLGSAGIVAYDFLGKMIWRRNDLGPQIHIWGNASSPVPYAKGNVFIQLWGPGTNVFLVAVNASTGKTIWKRNLPEAQGKEAKHWYGSWATPVIRNNNGRDELLIGLPKRLAAFNPTTGEELWSCEGLGDLVYNNPVFTGDLVLATSGYGGPALCVKAAKGAFGNITEKRLWVTEKRNLQRIGTGMVVDEHYFILTEPGILQCIDMATGEIVKQERIGKGGNWGSIAQVANRLYVTNTSGQTLVLSPSNNFKLLATNSVNEMTRGSPAFSNGQVFLRTHKTLWCFGK
jgi:outer membrane protein assembly factor BamB